MAHDKSMIIKKGSQRATIMASSLGVWERNGWEATDEEPKTAAKKAAAAKKRAATKAAEKKDSGE